MLLGDHLRRTFEPGEEFQISRAALFQCHFRKCDVGFRVLGGNTLSSLTVFDDEFRVFQQGLRDFNALLVSCIEINGKAEVVAFMDADIRDIDIAVEMADQHAPGNCTLSINAVETAGDRPASIGDWR